MKLCKYQPYTNGQGGKEAFEKLTSVFYTKVLKDDLLEPVFRNMSPEHSQHVAHFIAEVFGGPQLYTSGDGGNHAGMILRHAGKQLDDTKRKRWIQLFLETADETGMPDDPEFRSSLVGYLEWGSRLAVINSQSSDVNIDDTASMPKWGWGETGGPYQPEKQK